MKQQTLVATGMSVGLHAALLAMIAAQAVTGPRPAPGHAIAVSFDLPRLSSVPVSPVAAPELPSSKPVSPEAGIAPADAPAVAPQASARPLAALSATPVDASPVLAGAPPAPVGPASRPDQAASVSAPQLPMAALPAERRGAAPEAARPDAMPPQPLPSQPLSSAEAGPAALGPALAPQPLRLAPTARPAEAVSPQPPMALRQAERPIAGIAPAPVPAVGPQASASPFASLPPAPPSPGAAAPEAVSPQPPMALRQAERPMAGIAPAPVPAVEPQASASPRASLPPNPSPGAPAPEAVLAAAAAPSAFAPALAPQPRPLAPASPSEGLVAGGAALGPGAVPSGSAAAVPDAPAMRPAALPETVTTPVPPRPSLTSSLAAPLAADVTDAVRLEEIRGFLEGYDGGSCFYAAARAGTSPGPMIESFSAAPEKFATLDRAFKAGTGLEAAVAGQRVWSAQCAAVDFFRRLPRRSGREPVLDLARRDLRGGDGLEGAIGNAGGRRLGLFVISETGAVEDVSASIRAEGGIPVFALPPLRGPPGGPFPQMLVLVASDGGIPSHPATIDELFRPLMAGGMAPSVTAKLFLVTR